MTTNIDRDRAIARVVFLLPALTDDGLARLLREAEEIALTYPRELTNESLAAEQREREVDVTPLLAAHRRVQAMPADKIQEARARLSRSYSAPMSACRHGGYISGREIVWPDGERYPIDPDVTLPTIQARPDLYEPTKPGHEWRYDEQVGEWHQVPTAPMQGCDGGHPGCSVCDAAAEKLAIPVPVDPETAGERGRPWQPTPGARVVTAARLDPVRTARFGPRLPRSSGTVKGSADDIGEALYVTHDSGEIHAYLADELAPAPEEVRS